jgi:biopolymer transport protein ExbD
MDEPRLETMPLVDVIFLLLTFFVFAMVLMVRADVLNVTLPQIGSGAPTQRNALITIAIDQTGGVFLNGDPVELDQLGETTKQMIADQTLVGDEPRVVIAADERSSSGSLLHALDALSAAGVTNVSVMGKPTTSPTAPAPSDAASPD